MNPYKKQTEYFGGACEHYTMDVDMPARVCMICLAAQVKRMAEQIRELMPVKSDGNNEG